MTSEISRRNLLASAGAGLLAMGVGLPTLGACQREPVARPLTTPNNWDELRAMFGLDPTRVHLAGLLLASHPTPVRNAIEEYRSELDANPVDAWHGNHPKAEIDAREAAAKYMNATHGDIALTGSTTMGLAILYNGIALKPGQEFLSTTHDHQVTHQSIRLRCRKTGHGSRFVPLYNNPSHVSVQEVTESLAREIRPETRVVAVTWVHSSTGVRLPIAQMAEVVARANRGRKEEDRALFCVDGVHGFGNQVLDVKELGCDFFAAGCHKWLFGPRGTGVLWGRSEVHKFVQPTIPSFSGWEDWGSRMTPGGFHSFEHRWALTEAFKLHSELGQNRVRERIADLNRHCKEALAKMPNVKLYTPMSPELSAGLVCFDVAGIKPEEVVRRLAAKRIIASTTPYLISYARLTPSLLNTHEDVDKALAAIREMAG